MKHDAVFLDTVGLVAVWNMSDQWHRAAEEAFANLITERVEVYTTTLILLECANMAARRIFRADVVALWKLMECDGRVIRPTEEEMASSWEEFERGSAASPAVVDLISFRVMQRLGIRKAFTNDRHFSAAGFETLF